MESRVIPFKTFSERIKIAGTDDGRDISDRVKDLEMLLEAYRSGAVKSKN